MRSLLFVFAVAFSSAAAAQIKGTAICWSYDWDGSNATGAMVSMFEYVGKPSMRREETEKLVANALEKVSGRKSNRCDMQNYNQRHIEHELSTLRRVFGNLTFHKWEPPESVKRQYSYAGGEQPPKVVVAQEPPKAQAQLIIADRETAEVKARRAEFENEQKVADAKRLEAQARADRLNMQMKLAHEAEVAALKKYREQAQRELAARRAACAKGDKSQCGSQGTAQ